MPNLESLLGSCALITTLIGVLPQIYKTHMTKSSQDLSMPMLLNFFLCSLFWVLYGLMTESDFVVYSNYFGMATSLTSIGQKIYYDRLYSEKQRSNTTHHPKNEDNKIDLFAQISSNLGKEYRSIICLNSPEPLCQDLFQHYSHLPIMAIDGASEQLSRIGIKAQVILGDMDSHHPALFPDIEKIHLPDQNYCDFEKSLEYLAQNNYLPAIVTGLNLGNLDRVLNNIQIFMRYDLVSFSRSNIIFPLQTGETTITLPVNNKISIIGAPESCVSSRGLKWELDNKLLSFWGDNSYCNRSASNQVSLTIHSGRLLISIYNYDAI